MPRKTWRCISTARLFWRSQDSAETDSLIQVLCSVQAEMARGFGHTKRAEVLLKISTSISSAIKLVLQHLIPKLKCKISQFICCLTSSETFPIILVSPSALTSVSKCQNCFNLYGSVPIFNWNPQERYTLQKSNKFNLPSQLHNVRLYFEISFTHYLNNVSNLQASHILQYTSS